MSQFINSQSPDMPRSGQSLQPESTGGSRIDFIQQTDIGSTSVTISSGGAGTITVSVILYPEDMPEESKTSTNFLANDKVLVWPFFNIFIDTNEDAGYFWATGSSLTNEQKNIEISNIEHITPYSDASHTVSFLFTNYGADTHTVYFHIGAKFVFLV